MRLLQLSAIAYIGLAMLSSPVSATQITPPIECGNDLDCFLNAAKTCTQARINPKRLGFSRSERLEIQGSSDNKCRYYAVQSAIQHRGFACQFYSNEGFVLWLEMISRRRQVIYDSRKAETTYQKSIGQHTIETINGEDVGECLWR